MNNTFLLYDQIPISIRRKILNTLKNMILQNQKDLIDALYYDLHKPKFESKHMEIFPILKEIDYHLENFESWLEEKKSINPLNNLSLVLSSTNTCKIKRLPFGKVLIIGAWNYPLNLSIIPLIGAISAGNTVMLVLPDSDYTHHTSNKLYKLVNSYFPNSDYLTVNYGGKSNLDKILKYKWDFIFYTGSQRVGKIMYSKAAEQLTPIVLELGGKSPCIIESDINKLLIKRLVWGKLTNAGQTCIAPDYILVNKKKRKKLINDIKNTIIEFYGTNQLKSKDLSRIVNKSNFNRLKNILDIDKKYIYFGGDSVEQKLYIQPTILDFRSNVDRFLNSESMKNEIFGPIIPIFQYQSINNILTILEKHPTPLTAYLFGNNTKKYEHLIKSGSIVYNDTLMQMNTPLPFGGVGTSGIGNYHGKYTFDTFTYQKSILERGKYGEMSLRFPPYNNCYKLFLMEKLSKYVKNSNLIYKSFIIFVLILLFRCAKIKIYNLLNLIIKKVF